MDLPPIVFLILHCITAFTAFLIFVAGCVALNWASKWNSAWTIHSGCAPSTNCNIVVVANFIALALMLIFLAACALEITFVLIPYVPALQFFGRFRGGFIRAIVYIAGGLLALSIAGDLGIASGALMMILGAIWLAYDLLMHFGVLGGSDADAGGQEAQAE